MPPGPRDQGRAPSAKSSSLRATSSGYSTPSGYAVHVALSRPLALSTQVKGIWRGRSRVRSLCFSSMRPAASGAGLGQGDGGDPTRRSYLVEVDVRLDGRPFDEQTAHQEGPSVVQRPSGHELRHGDDGGVMGLQDLVKVARRADQPRPRR